LLLSCGLQLVLVWILVLCALNMWYMFSMVRAVMSGVA
jgi:hypothetical protein